jgi:mRNA-degrading endonuclease RelE of RelBE toxin-antitoxin system
MMKIRIQASGFFLRELKKLHKKDPTIDTSLKVLRDQLRQRETPGDQIPGVGHPVYKVRLAGKGRGKRGGYRVIYYISLPTVVLLVAIYSKSAQENISTVEIKRIIDEFLSE